MSVFRSLRYIGAQVIDDRSSKTVASATSASLRAGGKKYSFKNVEAAKRVGEAVAKKAIEAGVRRVVFDRGPYLYHGRVKALAEAARAAGLEF